MKRFDWTTLACWCVELTCLAVIFKFWGWKAEALALLGELFGTIRREIRYMKVYGSSK